MSTDLSTNPYHSRPAPSDAVDVKLSRPQSILLTLLVVVLLLRGGAMTVMWAVQLLSGLELRTHLYIAIFIKDSIYGIAALIGAVMLIPRHRLGWWAALIHWSWYFACEVVVVAAGAMLGWSIPVAHDPPELYRVMGFSSILAASGMAVLLWRPIAVACQAPVAARYRVATAILIFAVPIAFAVNGWMALK